MIRTTSNFVIEAFLQKLATADDCALVMDYDSVFVPFSSSSCERFPSITPKRLIDNMVANCRTRVAMVTEREARDLLRTFRELPRPEIWGRSGLERLHSNDRLRTYKFDDQMQGALLAVDHFLEGDGLGPLTTLKPGAIAVSWKGLSEPDACEARACAIRALSILSGLVGLSISETPNGIEASLRRNYTGRLLQILIEELPSRTPIAYLDSNWRSVASLQPLTADLSVLIAPSCLRSDVDACLQPPDQLIQFFADWVRVRGGEL